MTHREQSIDPQGRPMRHDDALTNKRQRSYFGLIMAGLILLMKSSKILTVLKAAKFSKAIITVVTMTVSAIAYAFAFGSWYFALALVGLLLIHEMGHVWAIKRLGYKASAPIFIPFLGALIFAPRMDDRHHEAYMAYGGPLIGSIPAIALFGVYYMMPAGPAANVVLVASYVGIFLNLFNLIPISPLDGGRITQAVGGYFPYVGLFVLAGITIMMKSPVMLLIWIIVLMDLTIIQTKIRLILAWICFVSMTAFMLLGFSQQPWWVDGLDIALGAFGVFAISAQMSQGHENTDDRPMPPLNYRWGWLAGYVLLIALLSLVLYFQIPLLPQKGVSEASAKKRPGSSTRGFHFEGLRTRGRVRRGFSWRRLRKAFLTPGCCFSFSIQASSSPRGTFTSVKCGVWLSIASPRAASNLAASTPFSKATMTWRGTKLMGELLPVRAHLSTHHFALGHRSAALGQSRVSG